MLSLPFFPSLQAEKNVRAELKRAKRALETLRRLAAFGIYDYELGLEKTGWERDSEIVLDQVVDVDVDMSMDQTLRNVGYGGDGDDEEEVGQEGSGHDADDHGSRAGEIFQAGEARTFKSVGIEMEGIEEGVAMMCLEGIPGLGTSS